MRICTPAAAPLLIVVVAFATCSERSIIAAPPRLELAQAHYDAGSVRQGERVEHTFVFRNSGGRDLRISRVRASCACAAGQPESAVPPGQTGEIVTSLDTAGLFGKVTRTIAVFSNDPATPALQLKLTADIDFDVAANPPEVYVGAVHPGEEVPLPGRLAVAADTEITRLESPGAVVDARLIEPAADGVPGVRRFRVRIRSQAPTGEFRENIIVHSTSRRTPALSVAVVGVVEENA